MASVLNIDDDLQFSSLILSKHPRSAETFSHRYVYLLAISCWLDALEPFILFFHFILSLHSLIVKNLWSTYV